MSVLKLESVSKVYDSGGSAVHAVKDLNLEVADGEIVSLLGSSGCGKTSTLRMVAGFESATRGQMRLGDRLINAMKPADRGVAMAFEGYSLYPPLTVAQNIGFALKSLRMEASEIQRRVKQMAEMLEIASVLDRYPASISGGQQQRASLARALIREAQLHLLDEPMGQLEPQLRALLRGRIKHYIKERGFTAILVTHDQTEANALSDRIAVMEAGELQQFASPDQLRDAPSNLFTGTFIGEPPMNVLSAEVDVRDGQVTIQLGEGAQLVYEQGDFSSAVLNVFASERKLTLGIRPHAVRVGGEGIPAQVMVNQWLGDQSHIAARLAGATLVAVKHDRAPYSRGELLNISLSPGDLHVFDPDTGRAIVHGGKMA